MVLLEVKDLLYTSEILRIFFGKFKHVYHNFDSIFSILLLQHHRRSFVFIVYLLIFDLPKQSHFWASYSQVFQKIPFSLNTKRLLRPREYHYFSFLIFAFLLSQYLRIISACLCFHSFDHAVPFRFSLFSTRTLIFFRIVFDPGSFCLLKFNFSVSSLLILFII